jgi:RND family efflux transporter MFP subunit
MRNQWSRLCLILMLFLAISQWRCGKSKEANNGGAGEAFTSEPAVKTISVGHREWVATVPITGNLHTLSSVEIKPEVSGRLNAAYFKEGDFVRKDQLLAEIDPVNYKLAYDQAAATLQVAEAGLDRARISAEHAKTERDRADNLLKSGGITEKDHQAAVTGIKDAESQVRLAEAQCAQARASLAVADKALKDCKIFSPAEGHIQKKYFDKGSLLTAGIAIYTIVDNSQLELECVVPSYQLASLKLGQHATFQTPTWNDRRFDGIVSAINPEIESDNRSVKVKLQIANPKGDLRSGMYARGEIVTGSDSNALVIPRDSLIPEKEGSSGAGIFIVKEGKAHRIEIEIADTQQDQVRVRHGLKEGDVVITEMGPSLKDGTAVRLR